jgi:hypothetical protein
MKTKAKWLSEVMVMVALGFTLAGAPLAQTTTTDVRDFEVISVDGNKLVVRDQRGTQEITVPDDFRFTVDGKKMSVSELKAGMKGTAIVTTTTTIKPVVVTEVREGEVLRAAAMSVTVREGDAVRRYTQGELDEKGVQIVKDGRPVRVADLRRGDKLTATIITNRPPTVLTEQEVQATLAESKAEPPATQVATIAGAAQPAAPAASAQPPASPQPSAPQPASRPAEPPGMGLTWYVVIAVLVAVALFVFLRRRKGP